MGRRPAGATESSSSNDARFGSQTSPNASEAIETAFASVTATKPSQRYGTLDEAWQKCETLPQRNAEGVRSLATSTSGRRLKPLFSARLVQRKGELGLRFIYKCRLLGPQFEKIFHQRRNCPDRGSVGQAGRCRGSQACCLANGLHGARGVPPSRDAAPEARVGPYRVGLSGVFSGSRALPCWLRLRYLCGGETELAEFRTQFRDSWRHSRSFMEIYC